MASLPSIVVGLFGLLVFVTLTGWGYTVMGGALALTILNLPSLTRVCENAIVDIPNSVKEASLGLGATKMADNCKNHDPFCSASNYHRCYFSSRKNLR
ncbi:hypothetical protein GCM10020331_082320 [Ectobacillus funiculus]